MPGVDLNARRRVQSKYNERNWEKRENFGRRARKRVFGHGDLPIEGPGQGTVDRHP